MSVTLSPPSQLGFPRPLTQIVKRSLYIHNPHSSPVAFKVKTTAPRQYCVRPNQGRVEPGENVEVQIVLQPLPADPPPHAKCKDKFLVQSAFIPPDDEMHSLPEMWAQVERANKAAVHEQKIRCAYLSAEDGTGNANGIPEENEDAGSPVDHRLDESNGLTRWSMNQREFDPVLFPNGGRTVWDLPPYQKDDPTNAARRQAHRDCPRQHDLLVNVHIHPGIYSAAEASPSPKLHHSTTNGEKDLPAPPAASHHNMPGTAATAAALSAPLMAGTALHSTSSAAPTGTRDIKSDVNEPKLPALSAADVSSMGNPTNSALERGLLSTTSDSDKLQMALKEIDRLKSQLAEAQGPTVTGLRKRGGPGADNSTSAPGAQVATAQQTASGVPLEVCAGLVFAVFVLTYLFF